MSRLVGLCLLSSVSHHRLWVMMDGNSVLTNMMHHRWTWVEMLFSYNRRHTLAPKHWLLRGRQLLGSSAVILLLRELHIQGSLNFCPMAHMMSPALQMLHSSLLGSCSGGQTRTVACKQSRLTLLRFKNGAAVSWPYSMSGIQVPLVCFLIKYLIMRVYVSKPTPLPMPSA